MLEREQDLHQGGLGRLDRQGTLEVTDSATEEVIATIPEGTPEDVDKAVRPPPRAFPAWAATPHRGAGQAPAPASARRSPPGPTSWPRSSPTRWACR